MHRFVSKLVDVQKFNIAVIIAVIANSVLKRAMSRPAWRADSPDVTMFFNLAY